MSQEAQSYFGQFFFILKTTHLNLFHVLIFLDPASKRRSMILLLLALIAVTPSLLAFQTPLFAPLHSSSCIKLFRLLSIFWGKFTRITSTLRVIQWVSNKLKWNSKTFLITYKILHCTFLAYLSFSLVISQQPRRQSSSPSFHPLVPCYFSSCLRLRVGGKSLLLPIIILHPSTPPNVF